MDRENYNKKATIINQITQLCEQMNSKIVELSEEEYDSKNIGKLSKGLAFISYGLKDEKSGLKKERKKFYKDSKK